MIDEKTVLQVLTEQKEELGSYKPKKWVSRKEEILFEYGSTLAQVVIGVRRSGKSTLCHKVLLEQGIRYGYVNLDDDRLAKAQTEDLNTILSCVYQLYGTDISYLFLDEIQNVDGWHLFVNRLLRIGMHVFVTGSNAKLLGSELATHLTGRYNEIRLYPFSFSEYCAFHGIDTTNITTKADADRKRALTDYMNTGGFPEMQGLRNKRGYVQSLIEAIILKDIQNRFKIRHVEELRKIAHYVINNVCQEVNYEEMTRLFELGDKTIKKYIDYLQQAFLVQLLNRHSFKSKERIRNQKSYVIDIGLLGNRDNAMMTESIGWRLENIIYIELLRRAARDFLDVYYFKPNARAKEVDFVVYDKGTAVELIQVAYDIEAPKTYNRELSSLVTASNQLHCDRLTLISFAATKDVVIEEKTIHIRSVIDWLLT